MKRVLFLGLAIVFSLAACQIKEKRFTEQSPEIDTYKKVIAAYEARDWEAMANHYADTAKIMNNVLEKDGQTLAELVQMDKEDALLFSSWDYIDDQSEFEMTITDSGKTYVNFWGIWQGTLTANNKTYTIPAHISSEFVAGKIVREYGYWDLSKIMLDVQAMQEATKTASEEPEMTEEKTSEN